MWQLALLAALAFAGGTLLCFGVCAWLSPRVLDWVAAQADSRAHALRAYRVHRAESLAEQLKLRQGRERSSVETVGLPVGCHSGLPPVVPSGRSGLRAF